MALMAWGMFVFTMDTLPYQQLQHQLKWRHTATARVGQRPSRQYLGPDDETISLSGVLLPELTGGRLSLSMVREMGDMGQAWPLIEGTGAFLGLFVLEDFSVTRSVFFDDGAARRYEFTLSLARVDDDLMEMLGNLAGIVKGLLP